MSTRTPVVLLIFNRPDLTRLVFDAIRQARPPELLIVADGPRGNVASDADRCAQTRAVVEKIDWDCRVHRQYASENLGCKARVSSGLDWAFSLVERAMVIEDDCLPSPAFFDFCDELLERYADDGRVMSIAGTSWWNGGGRATGSYYFSRLPLIWGWATWRWAWQRYDVTMARLPEIQAGGWLHDVLQDEMAEQRFQRRFERVRQGSVDTWDFQWYFAHFIQSGLSIHPYANLVTNLGFRDDATHTKSSDVRANKPLERLTFPLQHPPFVIADSKADTHIAGQVIGAPRGGFVNKIKRALCSEKRRR